MHLHVSNDNCLVHVFYNYVVYKMYLFIILEYPLFNVLMLLPWFGRNEKLMFVLICN